MKWTILFEQTHSNVFDIEEGWKYKYGNKG